MSLNFLINTEINDYSTYTNLILIDDQVMNREIFYNSSNLSTFPIIYYEINDINIKDTLGTNSLETTDILKNIPTIQDIPSEENIPIIQDVALVPKITQKEELLNFIKNNNFVNLKRLSIVANDTFITRNKPFLDSEAFFNAGDLELEPGTGSNYSTNLQYLINFIKEGKIEYVDFLMCGALQHENWIKYFEIIKKETGITVGASNDQTGNIQYGGDWLLESTNEDIKNVYFTEQISNYTETLATTIIDSSRTIMQADCSGYTWPVTITRKAVVTMGENIILSESEGVYKYFIFGSDGVTFNGAGFKISINGIQNYPGLINNGTNSAVGFANTTIQNVNIDILGSTTLVNGGGWIAQSYYSNGKSNNIIIGCSSSGIISGDYSGGIAGANAGYSGSCTISSCSSSGIISGDYSGGIAGDWFGYNTNIPCSITNCFSIGDISGFNAGGIVGADVGYNNISGSSPTVSITNCYSLGIVSLTCGGICGGTEGYSYTNIPTVTINNCYCLHGLIVSPNLVAINPIQNKCYEASGNWIDSVAITSLDSLTTPTYISGLLINPIGSVWADISFNDNSPYVFALFGNPPYLIPSANIKPGQSTQDGIDISGYTYSMIAISNSPPAPPTNYPFITINPITGSITVSSNGLPGTYTIYIYYYDINGNYSVSTFSLVISANIIPVILAIDLGKFYSKSSRKKTAKLIKKRIDKL